MPALLGLSRPEGVGRSGRIALSLVGAQCAADRPDRIGEYADGGAPHRERAPGSFS
jgi:hypothetical protein